MAIPRTSSKHSMRRICIRSRCNVPAGRRYSIILKSIRRQIDPGKVFFMEKYQFNITIDAPKERVWEILWGEETYPAWAAAFMEGSSVETDGWKKDSKVLFLDGKGSGMVAIIEDNRTNELMSFKHIGMVSNGVEDTESDKVKEWAGVHENYTLEEADGSTHLRVEMDIGKEWLDYFQKTWPVALDKVKM